MMLAGPRLRVVPVTTHIALRDVAKLLTTEDIVRCGLAAVDGLVRWLDIASPRLAVCGLNPHVYEGGRLGDEEERIIVPAIQQLRAMGIDIDGPMVADSVFYRAMTGRFDAVLCMYHDQALGPLKTVHFQDGYNLTCGLPVPRISPDHGTAYDIAGKGIADPGSMVQALQRAERMAALTWNTGEIDMSNKFRHIQTKSTGALALCVGLAFGLSGCNKDDQKPQPGAKVADQDKQHHANGPQAPEKRVESVAAELVTSLDAEYQIELARSTGGESVTLPWHEATATAAAAPRKPGDEDRLGGAPREGVQNTGKPDQPGAPHSSDDKNAAAKNGDDKNSPVQVGGPPAKREPRQWLATTVLVGRTNVYLDGKAIGPVRCHADAGLCDATALRASTGKQALTLILRR